MEPTPPVASAHDAFHDALRSLDAPAAKLFAILAIADPANISRLCEVAGEVGLRQTATRAHSTASLRAAIESLVAKRLVTQMDDGRYRVAFGRRADGMRWAAGRDDFDRMASVAAPPYSTDLFDARMAVYKKGANAIVLLDRLNARNQEAARTLALEVTGSFDAAWFDTLEPELRSRLFGLAMVGLETMPEPSIGIYPHYAADIGRFDGVSDRTVAAFGGVAALRGDLSVLRALADWTPSVWVRASARAAALVIEGRYDEAAEQAALLPIPKRGEHAGVLLLLSIIALRTISPHSDHARRLLAYGAKKGEPLVQSFRVYAAVADESAGAARSTIRFARDAPSDPLTSICFALLPVDPVLDSYGLVRHVDGLSLGAEAYRTFGFLWLADQYAAAAWRTYELLPARHRELIRKAPAPPEHTFGPSLFDARTTREPWELHLDKLESAIEKAAPRTTEAASNTVERLIWRVSERFMEVEPYVQKRTAGGKWTAGRKLAIKHLIGSTPTTATLPPEDVRVAQHAREHRQAGYGYPVITHSIQARAWLDLVGHPRVYLGDEEHPRQVVRGEPKLSVVTNNDGSVIFLDPPGLQAGVNVRASGDQLVVYEVGDDLKTLVEALRAKQAIPAAGKDRLARVLERLAPFLPVESAEQVGAKQIVADSTPYVRIIPSRGGLSVSLLVRPLGPSTVLVSPGRGQPTVVAQIAGETVQAERDFAQELKHAEAVLAACPALAERETGHHSYRLEDPEDCLDFISSLRGLGDSIHVEWPHGTPLRLRSRVGRRALKGKLERTQGAFSLDAALEIDAELSMDLSEILELLAQHPGRFVQLASGEYVELEQDLREVLEGIAAARSAAPSRAGGVAVPSSALSVIDQLTREGTGLSFDRRSKEWRARFSEVFEKAPTIPKGFQGELRDYQVEGFRWLARLADLDLGACLADDMGLGKTIQIIALLLRRGSSGPALIVAPTSVCENWRREIERFAPSLRITAFWGSDRDEALGALSKRDVLITSYTLLQQNDKALQAIDWATAVLDEAQMIKNPETLRAQAAFGVRASARVVATGTPVENHAGDLYSLFQFLNPGLLGAFAAFNARLTAGGSSSRAIKRLLTPFILRRTKSQVLQALPPITEVQRTVLMTPGEAKLYESVRKAALAKLKDAGRGGKGQIEILAELTRLRRLCCHPRLVAPESELTSSKLESFLELAEELVASRHRALVFSQFTDVLALVKPLLDAKKITYQYLDGSTAPKQRAAAVDAFQEGQGDLFLISLKAGGFGLNLTAADYVIHLDPWWNPAVESQATDRAHRIGQTRPVTVYRLVTAGTIESRIVELHREKRDLADAVLAETDRAAKMGADEMRSLLEA
jgi:superfamily II DNA or RNA helicase